jgi:3',5'-cyclic AMP phosphodiesterase CpdA
MRLAHFSDLHLGARGSTVKRAAALLDRAIDAGAEHLLLGGDVVDRGNLDDAERLLEAFARRGFEGPGKITAVPGNHDIWPIGEGGWKRDLVRWAREELAALVRAENYTAQRRYDRFQRLFPIGKRGADSMARDDGYPAVKQVGPALVGLLDTTANRALRHAQGRFPPREAQWVFDRLRRWDGPTLLLMHHWPFEWSVLDVRMELASLSWFKRGMLEATLAIVGLDEKDLHHVADVNFRDLTAVQDALESALLDVVLCGHLHSWEGARARAFDRKIGSVRVHCMGRSGGIHQKTGAEHGFHLIDLGSNGVRVKTIHVPRAALA